MIELVPPSKRDIKIAVVLYVLNLIDMVSTLYGVKHGATEMNPLMALALNNGDLTFVIAKVFGMGFATLLLLYVPISKKVNTVLLFLAGMYAMLVMTHMFMFWSKV